MRSRRCRGKYPKCRQPLTPALSPPLRKGEEGGSGTGEFRQVPFPHLIGEEGQRVSEELGQEVGLFMRRAGRHEERGGILFSCPPALLINLPLHRPLEQARGDEGEFHPPRMREDALNQDATQEGLEGRAAMVALDMVARGFQQLTVVDAAGTRRFASATAQTVIYMPDSRLDERYPPLLKSAHEINTAPGGIVLIASLQVSRARAKAESAMDAGEGLGLVKEAREVGGRWTHGKWVGRAAPSPLLGGEEKVAEGRMRGAASCAIARHPSPRPSPHLRGREREETPNR